MIDNSLRYLYEITILGLLLISVTYGLRYGFKQSTYFVFYSLFVILVESISKLLNYYFEVNNGIIYNIFSIGSGIYIFYFYYKNIVNTKVRTFAIVLGVISTIVMFKFYIDFGVRYYNIQSGTTYAIFNILVSLIWFYDLIQNPDEISATKKHAFWMSAALLLWSVFFCFRIIPMYFFQIKDPKFMSLLQYIFNSINIVTYLLFIQGVLCSRYLSKSNPHS